MSNGRLKNICFGFVLGFSILLNILFIRLDVFPQIKQKITEYKSHYVSREIGSSQFKRLIMNGAKIRLDSKYVVDNELSSSNSFKDKLYNCFFSKDISTYEYGEQGLLMWYTIQVAIANNDTGLIELIKVKFDEAFLSSDKNLISKTDQAIYGCVAIELFKITKDNRYKDFSRQIFSMLSELDRKYGIICYRVGGEQQVDLLGFVCPFLSEYGRCYNNKKSTELSLKLIDNYAEFGVDGMTGIPSQGYDLEFKLKTGYSNWGRGMAWYIIAISSIDQEKLKPATRRKIETFTETLVDLFNDGLIVQFPGHSEAIDMSATLPIIYFLHKESKLTMSSSEFITEVAPFIHANGLVGFNSPSITSGASPESYLYHDMAQGILVLLFNQLN